MTIKKINILRNWGTRTGGDCNKEFYNVSVTEPYDLVQFVIAELNLDIYWHTSIGVPLNTSEEKIKKYVEKYCNTLKVQDIKDYKKFINNGDKYGWD